MTYSPKHTYPKILCAVALTLVTLLLTGCPGGQMSNLDPFPTERYLEAPLNLQGNVFLLEAQIEMDSQLAWEEGVGKLLAVRVAGDDSLVVIFLPESLNQNMLPNQRYRFKVSVGRRGLLQVSAVEKY